MIEDNIINELPIYDIKDYEKRYLGEKYPNYFDNLYVENDKHDIPHVIHRMRRLRNNFKIKESECYVYDERDTDCKILNANQINYIEKMAEDLGLNYEQFITNGLKIHAVYKIFKM